jgi:ABC-type branched-subunit amino acid transport system substrate-binding protein
MRKLIISILALVILAAMLAGGCAKPAPSTGPAPAPAAPQTLDIGIVTPLTGAIALLGDSMRNGILLAIDDQNAQGGVTIAGEKYMLNPIIRDDKMDVVVGKNIAEELVFSNKVKVIAGPFGADAISVQTVTEPNKVIGFFLVPSVPQMCNPNKPFTFYGGGYPLNSLVNGAAYIQKFYPEAKTVVSSPLGIPDMQQWVDYSNVICKRYGFNWLGYEQIPVTATDFMPYIPRMLAKNPDIIDTNQAGGALGNLAALLVKELRQAGFTGVIWLPTPPTKGLIEALPAEYQRDIVSNDIDPEDPIVSQAVRDLYQKHIKKFGTKPETDIVYKFYNGMKAMFEVINGQDTMDTTVWMKGIEKYHWPGVWGFDQFWVGKPIFGIDRLLLTHFWVSVYKDGKLTTVWEAPIPWDLFVEQR